MFEVHPRLSRRFAPLTMIAHLTGRDQIVPRMAATARPGDDVVDRELDIATAAILAGVVVADEDFSAGELDAGAGASNWINEAND